MDFIKSKIVIVGGLEFANEEIKSILTKGIKESEILAITNDKSSELEFKNVEVKFDHYLLKIISSENLIYGIVAIDKIMGDIIGIQSSMIILDEDSRYFAEVDGLNVSIFGNAEETQSSEFEKLVRDFLSRFRIIPDLEKIRAAHKQLKSIKSKSIEKRKDLIEAAKEIIDRNKIETYDDKSNVYSIIEQTELDREIFNLLKD